MGRRAAISARSREKGRSMLQCCVQCPRRPPLTSTLVVVAAREGHVEREQCAVAVDRLAHRPLRLVVADDQRIEDAKGGGVEPEPVCEERPEGVGQAACQPRPRFGQMGDVDLTKIVLPCVRKVGAHAGVHRGAGLGHESLDLVFAQHGCIRLVDSIRIAQHQRVLAIETLHSYAVSHKIRVRETPVISIDHLCCIEVERRVCALPSVLRGSAIPEDFKHLRSSKMRCGGPARQQGARLHEQPHGAVVSRCVSPAKQPCAVPRDLAGGPQPFRLIVPHR